MSDTYRDNGLNTPVTKRAQKFKDCVTERYDDSHNGSELDLNADTLDSYSPGATADAQEATAPTKDLEGWVSWVRHWGGLTPDERLEKQQLLLTELSSLTKHIAIYDLRDTDSEHPELQWGLDSPRLRAMGAERRGLHQKVLLSQLSQLTDMMAGTEEFPVRIGSPGLEALRSSTRAMDEYYGRKPSDRSVSTLIRLSEEREGHWQRQRASDQEWQERDMADINRRIEVRKREAEIRDRELKLASVQKQQGAYGMGSEEEKGVSARGV
ncbi:hypothetical protein F5Y18DRAFT_138857 [Xylariaceae sp. FL1019]|nr:hypothetical protein F5Y18DRAFT_138857 [Xylariaceae sp. FL1019]